MNAQRGSPIHVAVIDDDDGVRNALCATFVSAGYTVSSFADAEGFLAAQRGTPCACLVSDVQMPGMGGIELALRMTTEEPGLPVILISAYANDALRRRAVDAGAVCLFDKPFDSDHLLHRVNSLLET